MKEQVDIPTLAMTNISTIREAGIAFLPQIGMAIGVLFAGWIIAKLTVFCILKIAHLTDKLFRQVSFYARYTPADRSKKNTSKLLSSIAYWLIIAFTVVLALQSLGVKNLMPWTKHFASYLPSFFAGALIILIGHIAGRLIRESILDLTNFEHNRFVAYLISGVIQFMAVILGLQQLHIDVGFIIDLFNLTYGIVLAGVALAVALSVYKIIADLLLMKMIVRHLVIGQSVEVAEFKGVISSMNSTSITLTSHNKAQDDVLIVPSKYLSEFPIRICEH